MKVNVINLIFFTLTLISCGKYREFDHLELIDQSYTGAVSITESEGDVSGIYIGDNDFGTYTFVWDNPSRWVEFAADNMASRGGSVRFILRDSRGREIAAKTLTRGFSYRISTVGRRGKWKVSLVFTNFEGTGTFEVKPIN